MKKTLLIFIICLTIPTLSSAYWMGHRRGGGSCSTPSTGTVFNEGFIGAGVENAQWVTATGAPNPDFTLTGSPPAAACSEGVQISVNDAQPNEGYYYDLGSAYGPSTMDADLYMYIQFTDDSLDAFGPIDFANIAYSETTPQPSSSAIMQVWDDGSNIQVRGSNGGGSNSDVITVARDTWVLLHLHQDTGTGATSYIECPSGCADASSKTFTRGTGLTFRYIWNAVTSGVGAGESLTYEVGYAYFSTPAP